jgi:ethanolamine utilization protein EutN
VQPITPGLTDTGKQVLCTDCTGAGAGEIVYWTRGKEASFPFLPKEVPTDMTVVGIVDSVNLGRDPAAIGDLVSTQKHESHQGRKALLVQPLNLDGTDRGDALIAFDAVDAGIGDRVLVVTEGFSAMTAVGRPNSPIDMAVIGFIDRIDLLPGEA